MKVIVIFLLVLITAAISANAQTQADTVLYQIETTDGNEFIGTISREDSTRTFIKTEKFGELSILNSEIKRKEIIKVQQIKDGKLWFENPQETRYFWAPNGYGLKRGEGYYQNIWVLWNQFSYGITDNFSIGGGIIPLFLFGVETPVFATIKFSVPVVENKFNIGGGAIAGYVLGVESQGSFGILYGLTTFGSRDNNVTLGLGYPFAGGEWAPAPLINFSGLFRVSNRGYFITENYLFTSEGQTLVMLSMGGRSIIKKISLDYGLFIPLSSDMDGFVAIPWLGLEVPFGKTN